MVDVCNPSQNGCSEGRRYSEEDEEFGKEFWNSSTEAERPDGVGVGAIELSSEAKVDETGAVLSPQDSAGRRQRDGAEQSVSGQCGGGWQRRGASERSSRQPQGRQAGRTHFSDECYSQGVEGEVVSTVEREKAGCGWPVDLTLLLCKVRVSLARLGKGCHVEITHTKSLLDFSLVDGWMDGWRAELADRMSL
jgi:hypothetical protein